MANQAWPGYNNHGLRGRKLATQPPRTTTVHLQGTRVEEPPPVRNPEGLPRTVIMKRMPCVICILITHVWSGTSLAQEKTPGVLTLDRIFKSREFQAERLDAMHWDADGKSYTKLESAANGKEGQDLVRFETESGQKQVLVPAAQLVPAGKKAPLTIEEYSFSKDGAQLLIFTDSRRVWRANTRGDFWVLQLKTGKLTRLGGDAKASTLQFAKFSPDGSQVGFVRENNIYVQNLADGAIKPLTTDGSSKIINGTFDWVYEEELFLRDGWRWSPDGKEIAYWQLNSEGVKDFTLINYTDGLYPTLTVFPYPKAGETNSAGRVGVVSSTGGPTRWLDVPGDPRNHYIARMDWADNPSEIVLQQLNRLQNTNRLMLGDARTGKVRVILVEGDAAWVDIHDNDLHWLDDGKSFTWISERDGWRHVYVVSRDGSSVRRITSGNYDVVQLEKVDVKGGWVYFIASPDNPTQRYLYRVSLNGGPAERLTPANQAGTNSYALSPDCSWALHTHSALQSPPRVAIVRLPTHDAVRTLLTNDSLRKKVASLKRGPGEFFRVDNGEGTMLDGWILKPPGFDSTMRYPLFFYVYGEPWGQTAVDAWEGEQGLWHLMLAQQGYLVATVDNRGTPSPRGREWRKVIYRKIGVHASADQAAAVKAMSKWSYVDPKRVGIWGWSGGGSMTLNTMLRYPDLYHTGMAVAPVPDIKYYDTIYQERYMGLPQDNPEDYKRASPITFAGQLKGNLLIVHGTGDDNVHYQGTEALINALVAANKQFTMMAYPNRTHAIAEGPNTRRHLYELLTRYLREHLPAGPMTPVPAERPAEVLKRP